MEGSGMGIAGSVVHVDVHGECVMLWVDKYLFERLTPFHRVNAYTRHYSNKTVDPI